VSLRSFLRRARDATEFTDLGMIQNLRMVSGFSVKGSLRLIHSWLLLFLFQCKHFHNITLIGFVHKADVGKIAFLLGRFLGQDMTFESVFTFDFSGSGEGEPLLGAGICFHFWHVLTFLFTLY
jgi:hypothetical protein